MTFSSRKGMNIIAKKKKSSGCLSTLFLLPISLISVLMWYILKITLYIVLYLIIFIFCLIWYIILGLFKLIFHKSQFHTKCNNGEEYEQICCQKLKQHGFMHVKTTPRTGDHGIDILAKRAGKKYAIQCKYYSSSVGNHAIQEAFSGCSYYGYDIPVVLTNSIFTQNAIDEANKLGVQLWSQNKIPFSDKTFFSNLFKKQTISHQSPDNQSSFDITSKIQKNNTNYFQPKTEIAESNNVTCPSVTPLNSNNIINSETLYETQERDIHFEEAGKYIITKNIASIEVLQRMCKIGSTRATRIMDQLYEAGVVGPEEGTGPRKILMSMEEFENYLTHSSVTTTKWISSSKLEDIEEYSKLIEKIIKKPTDFSQSGIILKNMQNMIVTQISDDIKNDLLDDLIRFNTCNALSIILFDKNEFNFFAYATVPNLFIPVISKSSKLQGVFIWACNEMNTRTNLFLEHNEKNIFDYNKKAHLEKFDTLPIIIIIIDELYGLNDIFTDELDNILLDSGRRGIFIIGFSKLELKNIKLGSTGFLWKKYIGDQISGMFTPPASNLVS